MSTSNGITVAGVEMFECTGCGQTLPESSFSKAIMKRNKGNTVHQFKKCRVCRNKQAVERYHNLAADARRMAILDALPALGRVESVELRDELIEGISMLTKKKSKHQPEARSITAIVRSMRTRRSNQV